MAGRTCMEAAMSKLNYRMRTKAELKSALTDLGYEKEDIAETIEELESFGYVNDERYSEEFIRSSARKNWSSSRIIRALIKKGISSEMAEEAMDNYLASDDIRFSPDSFDRERALETGLRMAEEQLAKGKNIDERFFGKVGRRLMGLGYGSGTCYYVIGRIKEKANTSEQEERF